MSLCNIAARYIETKESAPGVLQSISFKNTEHFNFAYDIVDELGRLTPDRRAMLFVDKEKNQRTFTFAEMSEYSAKTAGYFAGLGIGKGDRVLLVLKRHYQFWFAILALHKLGAVAVPATHQLKEEDFLYRFREGKLKAIVATHEDDVVEEAEKAIQTLAAERARGEAAKTASHGEGQSSDALCQEKKKSDGPGEIIKVMTGVVRLGWHEFNEEMPAAAPLEGRVETDADDPMVMFFTSGTTGHPKMVTHNFLYPLGHYITAKYWQKVDPEGLHFSVADTGWGKALWGKLYGQWLCEAGVFVYDMESFVAHDFLMLFKTYPITTFCAPPTAYRVFVKRDLKKYGVEKLEYVTTAGEALNAEVWQQFYDKTGLEIMEGFGQTETTMSLGTLYGTAPKPGSMGKPSPMYDVHLMNPDGSLIEDDTVGEVVIRADRHEAAGKAVAEGALPPGLFSDYFGHREWMDEVWHDGFYHTGDTAYRDEDGYYWYVGRTDDLIKSCGYRVGPFEVESVLMELPYVLECAVTGVPDKNRGQLVKATIVLTDEKKAELAKCGDSQENQSEEAGNKPSSQEGQGDEAGNKSSQSKAEKLLSKEIMQYAKGHMAHYKVPRLVEFVEELPKTISGKVRRTELRKEK